MKNFAEKIRSLISVKLPSNSADLTPFDFVKNRKAILRELLIAKQSGTILGVYCKAFGEGMFLTGVEHVEISGTRQGYVVFYPYDLSGKLLVKNTIELEEIQMVSPFSRPYRNPLFGGKANLPFKVSVQSS